MPQKIAFKDALPYNETGKLLRRVIRAAHLGLDPGNVTALESEDAVEAIHRAGADFVLSYATLGVQSIFAFMERREMVIIGEGRDLFRIPVPDRLAGRSLAQSGIGERTGLNVVAIERDGDAVTNPGPVALLGKGGELLVIGTLEERQRFEEEYS